MSQNISSADCCSAKVHTSCILPFSILNRSIPGSLSLSAPLSATETTPAATKHSLLAAQLVITLNVPPLIQTTTFAEIGGNTSERLKKLASLFKTINVPYRIVKDMFAKAQGLNTSVDGVHFNSASAKILATEIEKIALR